MLKRQEQRWIDLRYGVLALLLAACSVVLAVLARDHDTFPLDRSVSAAARGLGSSYEPVALLFNEGDGVIAVGALVAGGGTLLARRHLHIAWIFLLAASARPLLNPLKGLIDRPRPSGDFPIVDVVYDSSFPSGHVMTAATVFGLWFVFAPYLVPRRLVLPTRVAAALATALSATSRMWAGVHWFSDTYGSVLWIGALLALLMALRPSLAHVTQGRRAPAGSSRATLVDAEEPSHPGS